MYSRRSSYVVDQPVGQGMRSLTPKTPTYPTTATAVQFQEPNLPESRTLSVLPLLAAFVLRAMPSVPLSLARAVPWAVSWAPLLVASIALWVGAWAPASVGFVRLPEPWVPAVELRKAQQSHRELSLPGVGSLSQVGSLDVVLVEQLPQA
jgi:hypothetical protein